MKTVNINVEHLARVEGHGNIVVNVENGELKTCKLEIVESPRFFEVMLKGRLYDEAQHITSRICGICSIGHTTASIRASEDALGITPTEQTVKLRRILLNGEFIQSHILHIYFLVAPDLFGVPNVVPLASSHPEVVKMALRLKKLGNDIGYVIGGRHVNPVSPTPGGFTSIPSKKELSDLLGRIKDRKDDLIKTVELYKTLKMPEFERNMEFISLGTDGDIYPLYDGYIKSSKGHRVTPQNYKDIVKEYEVQHSNSKHASMDNESYFVGALARFNNNYDLLNDFAKTVAKEVGLKPVCYNSFHNNTAQLVEVAHCWQESIELLEELLDKGVEHEEPLKPVRPGRGVGAVEVPRGILFHEYEFDDEFKVVKANCIIPTGQNLANIENDMRKFTPEILDKSEDDIRLHLEMLVRAYDPCISCSVHMLNVDFVGKRDEKK